jgi:hypothetical protein
MLCRSLVRKISFLLFHRIFNGSSHYNRFEFLKFQAGTFCDLGSLKRISVDIRREEGLGLVSASTEEPIGRGLIERA